MNNLNFYKIFRFKLFFFSFIKLKILEDNIYNKLSIES